MKRISVLILLFLLFAGVSKASPPDTLHYGVFGKIRVYHPATVPVAFVLLVSGDGGWEKRMDKMAGYAVQQGAIVVGINILQYLKNLRKRKTQCYYPAGDLESLSLALQKKYKLRHYFKPVLMGYSSGATLIYGALAQAPANTFKGGIAFGFCPDLEADKTLCEGSGLKTHPIKPGKSYYLEASDKLTAPFIVFHGTDDKVCDFSSADKYMKNVKNGEMVSLASVGHGFSSAEAWVPRFNASLKKIIALPSYAETKAKENALLQSQHLTALPGDYPLTLIPTALKDTLPIVFFVSGDGGWTSFDHMMSQTFSSRGMPVIGLDAQKYFWEEKTPEKTTADAALAIQHYLQQWNKKSFILVGYSFGACIVPYVANRLSPPLRNQLEGVYSISPDETADFEIHLSDMLNMGNPGDTYKVPDEIKRTRNHHPVCVFGEQEQAALRAAFGASGAKLILLPGDHHYDDHPEKVANAVFEDFLKPRR